MLKRLAPFLTILLGVLLDTAVLPAFYYGRYLIPLSLVIVILIGIQLGRMSGMLYGMIAGLLLDITAGSLGMKLIPYIIIGFLIGFLLDQQPEIDRSMERRERWQLLAVRMIWIAVLVVIHEIVMLVYQYFSTAIFHWIYICDLVIRVVMVTLLCILLYPPFRRIYIGKVNAARVKGRRFREVKHF